LSQSNFDRLLQKYLAGKCTEEEEKIVLEWYEALIQNSELHLSEAEKSQIEAKLWSKITANVQEQEKPDVKVKSLASHTWVRAAVVAAVLMIIATGVVLYLQRSTNKKQSSFAQAIAGYDSLVNKTAEQKTIMLSDSSFITLQPAAVVYYPARFTGPTRDVYLNGSAFFKVYHNPLKHFKVHIGHELTTEVLGTSFTISQNKTAGNIEVAVASGKVMVYAAAKDSTGAIVLTRNKKVTFNAASNRFITSIVDRPIPLPQPKDQHEAITPATGRLEFDEAVLQEVLQALSNAYGINIVPENEELAALHFTGNLANYDLYTQLDIICKSTQTAYEINGTQIIVKRNQK
jgi:transmembrane sensor